MFEIFSFILPFVEAKTADEWNSEGLRLGQAGKYEDSIKAYDEALKINPQYAQALYEKGLALKNLGRNDEANRAFEEASKLQKSPGFEILFAVAGLVTIAQLLKKAIK